MARKTIGIALSGGGARGFAHIGVLKALEDHSISIDFISGTSAGSFVGAAMASGMTVAELTAVAKKIGWLNMTSLSYSPRAILSNAPMGKFIRQHFPVQRFEDLSLPLSLVACDLETGEEVILKDHGDIAFAVRASCAVPGVFLPLTDENGRHLVDGGVTSPMPAKHVRRMGADIVIAVDLMACGAAFRGLPKTLAGAFFQSAMMMLRTASKNQHYRADVVIEPQIAHLRPDEIRKMDEFIELGERAALEQIDKIKELAEA
ncbi:MAG: patatin-like phospholipase family protein [Saprospiraceae bacterium]|nr:patatin-like phospholipase family protein [Pyrinomonadaceae bacterium]